MKSYEETVKALGEMQAWMTNPANAASVDDRIRDAFQSNIEFTAFIYEAKQLDVIRDVRKAARQS